MPVLKLQLNPFDLKFITWFEFSLLDSKVSTFRSELFVSTVFVLTKGVSASMAASDEVNLIDSKVSFVGIWLLICFLKSF